METKVYGDILLFHNYLETLLGSKTKIRILRTLNQHKNKEFTIRELSKHIATSHTGVRKALQGLYDMNVITIKAQGKNHILTLNNNSHLVPLLTQLFEYEENTIHELQKDISTHLTNIQGIEEVRIFGSIATGEETPRSDIDLYIITQDKERTMEHIPDLQILCSRKYGNLVTPYLLTPEEKENINNQQLVTNIRTKNIPILSDP